MFTTRPLAAWRVIAACAIGLLLFSQPAIPSTEKSGDAFKQGQWPFRPPVRLPVPEVRTTDQVANSIDAFIVRDLESLGLQLNSPAEKRTLLRRVTFEMTGLPPTVEEQQEFLADDSPQAYERVVERLLASPRYGEHWAQHWLDLVRYSETEGFKHDGLRPDAHKYRDYVIRAFNADLPYDRFIRQQIAGDELEPDNPDALIATGMIRLYADEINASNLVQRRQEILDDITDNVGLTFLGLTMGCARCHDHKFDEITQVDYFRLQACFAAILPEDDVPIATPQQMAEYEQLHDRWEAATKTIREAVDRDLADERKAALQEAISAYDPQTLAAIKTPEEQRTCLQRQLVAEADLWIEKQVARAYRRCSPEERKRYDQRMEELEKFDHLKPQPLPTVMTVFDGEGQPPATCVLAGGNYNQPGQEVTPGFPAFLGASDPQIVPIEGERRSTGRRSALAHWLARPDHPLTARVMVNRVWQYHFGQGIIATTNDFGVMGEAPSHRELLDWLAVEFTEHGWSLKHLHRMILLSRTYRQSSTVDPQDARHALAQEKDPQNRKLWHARRSRLEGESLRDAMLQTAGELNLRMFGPSALPQLPLELEENRYGWEPDPVVADRNRRSIYVLAQRNMRLPLLQAFDQPDMHSSCPRRTTTVTAPQALELLNGEVTDQAARHWSGRLLADCGEDTSKLIRTAYVQAFGRPARDEEIAAAERFLAEQAKLVAAESTPPDDKQLPSPVPSRMNRSQAAAIVDFCHALLCSNEFLYVD